MSVNSGGKSDDPATGSVVGSAPGTIRAFATRRTRSGLPPVRGAGAVRFGLPSRPFRDAWRRIVDPLGRDRRRPQADDAQRDGFHRETSAVIYNSAQTAQPQRRLHNLSTIDRQTLLIDIAEGERTEPWTIEDRMERRAPWVPLGNHIGWRSWLWPPWPTSVGAHREAGALAGRTRPLAPQRVWRHLGVLPAVLGLRRARWMWWGAAAATARHYGRHYRRCYDDRDEWDEWHRREHERMDRSNATSSRVQSGPDRIGSRGPRRRRAVLPPCPQSSS